MDTALAALRDPARGRRNLLALEAHLGAERYSALLPPLAVLLPRAADPDLALNNLERVFASSAARGYVPDLVMADARGLDGLLTLLAASQFFADTLAAVPDQLATVLGPPRRNPSTAELIAQLRAEVDAAADDATVLRAIRRFRQLQTLRIGVGDLIRGRPLEEVTRDLARVADATVEVALHAALRNTAKKYGPPLTADGQPGRLAALAFGKLGGDELNYSSDIDLMFVYDADGRTQGKRAGGVPNSEFYARTISELIRLVGSHTDVGFAYRIDLRLRPEGKRGPLARTVADTLSYYDVMGRTWERQALIKLRPIAGDLALGREFVAAVEPFVYRKYFSFSEINEVKALKRQMEARASQTGGDTADVKHGRGGIRDIEYTVQFLQLLNGGDLPAVRQRNTLLALDALEIAGCLTAQETYILADAYRFLRATEHRLQLLFDWQTHKLPADVDGLRTLARRMGYREVRGPAPETPPLTDTPSAVGPQRRSPLDEAPDPPGLDTRALLVDPLDLFLKDYHDKTRVDRAILDHLLHQAFTQDTAAEPETDLILHPDPDDATVRAALGKYPFRDVPTAYQNLSQLAREAVPFLSHRRCRHFLAGIAPQLVRAVAATPDPDHTLTTLEQVTASLGAKAVLYELFSVTPASLKLYVELCATSPFLSAILTTNPGMIDELLDSLVLDQPRPPEELRAELAELLRGASDPHPILHSFQDKELLRVGVRDLLGRDDIIATAAGLSDIADAVLAAVFDRTFGDLVAKYEPPALADGRPCRYAVLGLGKLGGRELGYHSDLDLMVLFEGDGRAGPVSTFQFFTDLTQRAIKALSQAGPLGKLYSTDMRLRPTGKSGSLVLPIDEFRRYHAGGGAATWERLALTRGRVGGGAADFGARVSAAVAAAATAGWSPPLLADIVSMREKLEAGVGPRSLKRGPGGVVDVEFVVQLLHLRYGKTHPAILQPNVWAAVDAAAAAGVLPVADARGLRDGYTFLRTVEGRLRLGTDRPLTAVPDADADRAKLARRLGYDTLADFDAAFARHTAEVRRLYLAAIARERRTG